MVVCVAVTRDGRIDPRWGRAARVAVAKVRGPDIDDWQEFDVGWDRLHDQGSEGGHHARVARFLSENHVDMVLAHHMGDGMRHMLQRMGLDVRLGLAGNARAAAVAATSQDTK